MTKKVLISMMVLLGTALALTTAAEEAPSPEERAEDATATRQAVFKLLAFARCTARLLARGEPADADGGRVNPIGIRIPGIGIHSV